VTPAGEVIFRPLNNYPPDKFYAAADAVAWGVFAPRRPSMERIKDQLAAIADEIATAATPTQGPIVSGITARPGMAAAWVRVGEHHREHFAQALARFAGQPVEGATAGDVFCVVMVGDTTELEALVVQAAAAVATLTGPEKILERPQAWGRMFKRLAA
jgi:hypothetical protein